MSRRLALFFVIVLISIFGKAQENNTSIIENFINFNRPQNAKVCVNCYKSIKKQGSKLTAAEQCKAELCKDQKDIHYKDQFEEQAEKIKLPKKLEKRIHKAVQKYERYKT